MRCPRWRGRVASLVDASGGAGCRGGRDAQREPARTGDPADNTADHGLDGHAACRVADDDPDRDTTDGADHRTVVWRRGAAQSPRTVADRIPRAGNAIVADATRRGHYPASAAADEGNATGDGDIRRGLSYRSIVNRAADCDAPCGDANTNPDRDESANDHTDESANDHTDGYTDRHANRHTRCYPKPRGDRGARVPCAAR